ncbi:MAG: ribosome silencing factor [Chlamydiota bacterium]
MDLLQSLAQAIYDKKGFNILALDVRGLSSMTDYYLIAEGNIDKHVQAIAKTAIEVARDQGVKPQMVEGQNAGEWVAIDFWGVMVHIFGPGLREYYRLERLWPEAELVELDINTD